MNNFVIHTTPQRVAIFFANYSIFLQRRQQTINYLDFDDDNTRIFLIFFFLIWILFCERMQAKKLVGSLTTIVSKAASFAHLLTIFIDFYLFTDSMKRLPSIQQVACHEDTKYNLIVLLCNNGK